MKYRRNDREISQNIATIPSFVRFNTALLTYQNPPPYSYPLIDEKINWFNNTVQTIANPLNGCNNFELHAIISKGRVNQINHRVFSSNANLVQHIGNDLLPIFRSCLSYSFEIRFISSADENTASIGSLIHSILQFEPIKRCKHLKFYLEFSSSLATQLPVASIVNWLNQNMNEVTNEEIKREQKTRTLELYIMGKSRWHLYLAHLVPVSTVTIENVVELFAQLKTVFLF